MRSTTAPRRRLAVGAAVVAVAVAGGLAVRSASAAWVMRDGDGCPYTPRWQAASTPLWVDVAAVGGVTYERLSLRTEIGSDRVGAAVGEIACTYGEDVAAPGYHLRDGEATFLPAGTVLHELRGSTPTFELVADTPDGLRVYRRDAAQVDGATGEDLLPFDPATVTGVAFVTGGEDATERGRVPDDEVAAVVAALRAAEVVGRDGEATGQLVHLRLERDGLPPVDLGVDVETGVTRDGLVVPPELLTQLRHAVGQ